MIQFRYLFTGLLLLLLLPAGGASAICTKGASVNTSWSQTICPATANERDVSKSADFNLFYGVEGCEGTTSTSSGGSTVPPPSTGGSGSTGSGGSQASGGASVPGGSSTTIEPLSCFKPGCIVKHFFPECKTCTGSSVILTNGTYNFTETDLTLPARGLPITWARHYRSNRILPANGGSFAEPADGPLGFGWATPYFARIENDAFIDDEGLYSPFKKDAAGNYLPDQINGLVLRKVSNGYELEEVGGSIRTFDVNGRLQTIKSRLGQTVTLSYDAQGKLTSVTDATGRTALSFTYNTAKRIELVTDAAGRTVRYLYDSFGNLEETFGPGDEHHRYSYNSYHGLLTKANALDETVTVSYAYPDRGIVKQVVDPVGTALLSQGKPATGHMKSFSYDFQNKTYYVTEPDGTVTKSTANADGRLTSEEQILAGGTLAGKKVEHGANRTETVTDAAGNVTIIQRDEWFNIVKSTDGEGNTTRISWNSQKRPTQITDPLGVVTRFEYDATGTLLQKKIEAQGTAQERVTTYTYTGFGELETVTVGGATTRLAYDANGQLKSVTDPLNKISTLEFDAAGNLTAAIDATSRRTTLTYDDNGHVLSVTDPLDHVTRYAYNAAGRLTQTTDALNRTTTVETDDRGRITAVIDALDNRKVFSYDGGGKLLSIAQGEAVTAFTYDGAGRLASVTDAENNTTRYSYADGGCSSCGASSAIPKAITDPFGAVTENLFDKAGRVTGVQDPLQNLTTLAYDAKGQVIRQTDGNGNVTSFAYDPLGRLVKQTDAENGETSFSYNQRDNLLSLTDPQGNTTRFEYDLAGRKTKETRPMGQVTRYSYFDNGLLQTVIDAKQQTTTYTYDAAGRLTEITYADGTNDAFSYDAVGNLTGYANPDVSGTIAYDPLNRKTGEIVTVGTNTKNFSYSYDARGNKNTYTSPEGLAHQYSYRKNDQLSSITIGSKVSTFVYDKTRLSKLTFPNGVTTDYGYNANGWLTSINTAGPGGTILTRTYTHDPLGNIQAKVSEHGPYQYGYDKTYQLTSADNPSQTDEYYTYDKVGNRLTSAATTGVWSHNGNNELLGYDAVSFEYDANGNTVKKTENGQVTVYEYNARNRLSKVILPDGKVASYAYDPFGRRIKKDVDGQVTLFVYADEGLIGEYDSSGTPQKAYGWKPDGLWGTDPLYQISNGQFAYYHNDHLFTPQRLTNDNGQIVWSAVYQTFGKAWVDPILSTVTNNLRFPGQYEDVETGLYYNFQRYYDSSNGRYIKIDPYGIVPFGPSVGRNPLYQYVLNNPLNYSDITGELPPQLITGALAGLGNFAYQLYKNGGRLECVNWWEVGSWAITGAGAGTVLRGGLTSMRQFFWNKNFTKLSGKYWKARGGAFNQIYGAGNLDHWAIPRAVAKKGGIMQGLGNAGWNLVEIPAKINQMIGMNGWMNPTMQKVARTAVSATVPATAVAGAYSGYQLGKKAQEDNCECK